MFKKGTILGYQNTGTLKRNQNGRQSFWLRRFNSLFSSMILAWGYPDAKASSIFCISSVINRRISIPSLVSHMFLQRRSDWQSVLPIYFFPHNRSTMRLPLETDKAKRLEKSWQLISSPSSMQRIPLYSAWERPNLFLIFSSCKRTPLPISPRMVINLLSPNLFFLDNYC